MMPLGLLAAVSAVAALAVAAPGLAGTRVIPSSGTTTLRVGAPGVDSGVQQPELRPGDPRKTKAAASNRPRPGLQERQVPEEAARRADRASSAVAGPNPELTLSFLGLNHRDQRLANGGNQFSLEPPDQALCVGNGFTVEVVNSVLRVSTQRRAPR